MPLFFIAAIGLILFLLFLRGLSQANSHVLTEILQWSSLTLLSISLVLFVVSGRIPHATALALVLLFLWIKHKYQTSKKPKLLVSPMDREEALKILELDELADKSQILEAYEAKLQQAKKLKNRSNAHRARLRHAKEKLLKIE
ncbi:MAG: hypothetical protein ACRC4G_05460 [Alphaproteobacteria bacterium]